jgi:ABC-type antimicrobial peptide transport system permease subunit
MFLYNLKIAIRNILKNRGFSFINIVGLSIGMACSLLILVMTYFMFSTDRFHENYNNIFILQQRLVLTTGDYTTDRTGGSMGPGISDSYPQVRQYTRYGRLGEILLSYNPENEESNYEPRSFIDDLGIAADSNFFKVFSFELLQGDPSIALKSENNIILTQELADKVFPDKDALGETIYLNKDVGLIVTGILKNIPDNSSIKFSYIAPFKTLETIVGYTIDGYGYTNFFSYFVLDDPVSADIINSTLNEFIDSKEEEEILEANRFLTHIKQAYLFGEQKNFIGIMIFGIIGFGILIIACLNYINLSTAKSMERAREVGIRKTAGAGKRQLTGQFLGESLILSIISVNFAVLLVEFALPKVSEMFEADLSIKYSDPAFWIIVTSIVLVVGILAGSYPALLLSSLKPSLILKDYRSSGSKGSRMRKILVVSQFALTTFFILCTFFLYRQLAYLESADLGFNKENVMFIPARGNIWNKYREVKNDLLKESSINYVSSASSLPNFADTGELEWGKEKDVENTIARIIRTDYDFLETFEMEMAQGRYFSREHSTDSIDAIIVNKEIISMLEYEGDPIGQRFQLKGKEYNIIGVIEDFVFFPVDIGGKALVMAFQETNDYIFLKVNEGFNESSLARIQDILKMHNPDYPFEYYMMSVYKNPMFESSDEMVATLSYFCGFGIFISCMGLFGLALYTVERRTKEIGIRKVFGASVTKIITLLSSGFIKLVMIATVIALPLSYLVLRMILQVFFIKIKLDPTIFILIAILMVIIAFLTVLWQSLSTARKNPVISLRYE